MSEENKDFLVPFFDSYFVNGICVKELEIGAKHKQQMEVVLRAWEYYKSNPWVTDMRKYFKQMGCPVSQVSQNLMYFEHIKNNYRLTTRAEAQNMVDYAARTALQQAAAAGDRQDLIKAANTLIKAHQLDKPAPLNDMSRNVAALDVVLTPYVEEIDSERKTVEDKTMLDILNQYGGSEDKTASKIARKVEDMKAESEEYE